MTIPMNNITPDHLRLHGNRHWLPVGNYNMGTVMAELMQNGTAGNYMSSIRGRVIDYALLLKCHNSFGVQDLTGTFTAGIFGSRSFVGQAGAWDNQMLQANNYDSGVDFSMANQPSDFNNTMGYTVDFWTYGNAAGIVNNNTTYWPVFGHNTSGISLVLIRRGTNLYDLSIFHDGYEQGVTRTRGMSLNAGMNHWAIVSDPVRGITNVWVNGYLIISVFGFLKLNHAHFRFGWYGQGPALNLVEFRLRKGVRYDTYADVIYHNQQRWDT